MVDSTVMTALNNLASEQSKVTEVKNKASQWLLDYVATLPNSVIQYYSIHMRLIVNSDVSYTLYPNLAAVYEGIFLWNYINAKIILINNGTISTMKGVMKISWVQKRKPK